MVARDDKQIQHWPMQLRFCLVSSCWHQRHVPVYFPLEWLNLKEMNPLLINMPHKDLLTVLLVEGSSLWVRSAMHTDINTSNQYEHSILIDILHVQMMDSEFICCQFRSQRPAVRQLLQLLLLLTADFVTSSHHMMSRYQRHDVTGIASVCFN